MNWITLSIIASVLWGLQYATFGAKMKGAAIGPYLFYYFASLAIGLLAWNLREGKFPKLAQGEFWPTAVCVLCGSLGTYITLLAVQKKNAPFVAMIEVSYPFFALVFGMMLFKQGEFSLRALVGGLLIAAGIYFVTSTGRSPA